MPRLLGQGPRLVLPSILGHWLDAFTECWLDSREEPPPHPSHPFLTPLEWPPSLSSPGRNTEMPLSSAKCFSFHSTVLIYQCRLTPSPASSSFPSSGLCHLPLVPGSVTSALCIPEAVSALPSSLLPPSPPPPNPPPISRLSSSSGWSYLKLPALARLESDSSSAPSGFPECSWVAVKDFRLSGMGMGLQRKKHPLLPFCPLLLGGGLAVLCVSLGLLAVYRTL